jgi:AraC family transcriptional regulator
MGSSASQSKPSFAAPQQFPSRNSESLRMMLLSDSPGVVEFAGGPNTIVSIHVGPSTEMVCRREGKSHRGTAIHGDIDIIPSGTAGVWELKERDTALVLSMTPEFLRRAAEDAGLDSRRLEIKNRFQMRDPQIEHIGWALKAEIENGYPCGRLYLDGLATALATRLVRCHSSFTPVTAKVNGGMSSRRLKQILSFIEDNLGADLGLWEIANVAGLSVSHCKALFREAMGMPLHQYVIRRRVERAATLLRECKTPISRIALETGFAHQSHLARHMRRLMGVTPGEFRRAVS